MSQGRRGEQEEVTVEWARKWDMISEVRHIGEGQGGIPSGS